MNERNGSWIVSIVKWIMNPDRTPTVTHCSSRYYRHEDSARDRYNNVIEFFEDEGYVMNPLLVPDREEYEGASGVWFSPDERKYPSVYATVFIDRNRT